MNILAVIPARGGSKGVPRKNIRELGGKPLIAWTIEAALRVKEITNTCLTTDDHEIYEQACYFFNGAFMRPPDLWGDGPILPIIQHAIGNVEFWEYNSARLTEWVLLLQPTSPFRKAKDIKRAIKLAERGDCDSVISVVRVGDNHPARMYRNEGGFLDPLMPEHQAERRQDLPPLYLRNGAIYLTRRDVLMAGSIIGKRVRAYEMPPDRSINIDTEEDFLLAEAMLRER